jgi:type IX secretion system PorP/SprF family membrane protein
LALPGNFINLHLGSPMLPGKNMKFSSSGILKGSLLLFCIVQALEVQCQDGGNSAQFFVNPYTFNPSYAGIEGRPAFYLSYRRQWINVDGSPKIGNLSFHTPLTRFSVGGNINNDKRGLFNTTSVLISGAYTIPLGDFKSMRFGLSTGGGFNMLDRSKLADTQDPALAGSSNSYILGNAGISFHIKSFHGGISLPAIFQPGYAPGSGSTLKPLQTVIIHASNRFYFAKNKHVLEPHLVYRYNIVLPPQMEAALVYHVNDILWAGGSYKQFFGSSAFLGFHFNKALGIGYSYSFKSQGENQLNSPSHEVQLTLLLGERRKDVPFYSFVDTDKEKKIKYPKTQSASAVIAQNKTTKTPVNNSTPVTNKPSLDKPTLDHPVDQNHQARLPESISQKPASEPVTEKPQEKKTEPVAVKQEPVKQTPVKQESVKLNAKTLGQMPHVHDTLHPMHAEEKEKIARLEKQADNPLAEHHDAPGTHPHAERHEFVKRGNHVSELPIGDFVVAGAFRSEINAKHFSDGLIQHGFKAQFGHLTEKNLWYVHISHTDNIEDARAARDKFRKLILFRDAWLLTVQH